MNGGETVFWVILIFFVASFVIGMIPDDNDPGSVE